MVRESFKLKKISSPLYTYVKMLILIFSTSIHALIAPIVLSIMHCKGPFTFVKISSSVANFYITITCPLVAIVALNDTYLTS